MDGQRQQQQRGEPQQERLRNGVQGLRLPLRPRLFEEGLRVAAADVLSLSRRPQTVVRRQRWRRGRRVGRLGQDVGRTADRRRQEEEAPSARGQTTRGRGVCDDDGRRLRRASAPRRQPVRFLKRFQFARHQFRQQRVARPLGIVRF